MPVKVSFADLSHTGKTVDANFFPLGCGYIASYALEHLKGQIEVQIFKYPADFSAYLEQTIPRIACFSNYSWNLGLNYEYARHLKARHPHVITVFGGPNYPIAEEVREQEAFLREHPAIDLYVDGEGEIAFTELYKILEGFNFDIGKFKDEVLYTKDAITRIDARDIEILKSMAAANPRKRVRLCAHPDPDDLVREMLIVLGAALFPEDTPFRLSGARLSPAWVRRYFQDSPEQAGSQSVTEQGLVLSQAGD